MNELEALLNTLDIKQLRKMLIWMWLNGMKVTIANVREWILVSE